MIGKTGRRQADGIQVMPSWSIWAGALALLLIAGGTAWLLLTYFGGGSPQDRVRLQALKTAGSIIIGSGGAVALLLSARRQRSTEIVLRLQDKELAQKNLAADDTRHDASERRITDLYTAAVEQLGSDKAPVRLGGLYALERLAQDNPSHRQTIVEVICAYLRMPDPEVWTDTETPGDSHHERARSRREEHQVRRAAQNVIIDHVRPDRGETGQPTNPKFWPDIDLDLMGAVLHNWNFDGCHVRRATFSYAQFHGEKALFRKTVFQGRAWFRKARFYGTAMFEETKFWDASEFEESTFSETAVFKGSQFNQVAWFTAASFRKQAIFDEANFCMSGFFKEANVNDRITFFSARANTDESVESWPPGWMFSRDGDRTGGALTMSPQTKAQKTLAHPGHGQ